MSLEFFTDINLPATLGPWVDLASNRNDYEEYFLGGKNGWNVELTMLLPSCLEIWDPQPPETL